MVSGLGPPFKHQYLHGSIPFWNSVVEHPDYDEFWQNAAWINRLQASRVPTLNVAGFWDEEDPWGPWQIFRHSRPGHYLPDWIEHMAHVRGLATRGHQLTKLFLHADGTLSFRAPQASGAGNAYRQYVSDPANPVPYRQRPISPTYPDGDWPTWEAADQRFVDDRPDVLSFVSAPLDHDITVTGPLAAKLFASTSGTDSDFIVKLIDVYPENAQKNDWKTDDGPKPGQYAQSLNGYQLPIAMEVRRGRYLVSYEKPHALVPNKPVEWDIPLRDHDHVFLKRHRIMVQIQSTWLPLIDRNPQKFVPSIYQAVASAFVPATQRIYSSPTMPSYLELPIVP